MCDIFRNFAAQKKCLKINNSKIMAKTTKPAGAPETQETLNQNEAFILKYKKPIIGCVVAALVIICGIIFICIINSDCFHLVVNGKEFYNNF